MRAFDAFTAFFGRSRTPPREWSAVAADHQYADQSHLIRDFRDLAGLTPTNYRALVTGAPNHVAFVQSSGLRAS